MNAERLQVGICFLFGWVIAGALGLGVGLGLMGAFSDVMESMISIVGSTPVAAAAGFVVGASLGVAQWFVLQRQVSWADWWVLATFSGMAIGFALANVFFYRNSLLTHGIVVGALLGTAQWLVLRYHIPKAGCWIPVTLGFAGIFCLIAFIFAIPVYFVANDMGLQDKAIFITLSHIEVGAIGGAIYGGITGLTLFLLFRQTDQSLSTPPQDTT